MAITRETVNGIATWTTDNDGVPVAEVGQDPSDLVASAVKILSNKKIPSLDPMANMPVVALTGSRDLANTDNGSWLRCTSASAVTLTIKIDATVALDSGFCCVVERWAAGNVTVVGENSGSLPLINGSATGSAATTAVRQIIVIKRSLVNDFNVASSAILTLTAMKEISFATQSATGDGTTTIDWTLGNKFNFTFGAFNETFTFTAPSGPTNLMLKLVQDGVGSRTATWPATVKWPAGVAPTLTTTAAGVDVVGMYFDGTNYYAQAGLAFA